MDRPSRFTSRNTVYREIFISLVLSGRPLIILFDDLRFPFGFKRMEGTLLLALKEIKPSKSELELQMAPDYEIEREISKWCIEKGITYFLKYDIEKHYLFTHMKIEETDSEKLHELLK